MDETKDLIRRAQSNDKLAQEKLLLDNTGLIWSVVRRFANRGHELEDLFQIGAMGLIKCINKFDAVNYDVKFSTYAVPMIIGEIKRFLRDDGMIKISRPLKELAIKIKRTQDDYVKLNNKSPTLEYLVKELNVPCEEILLALDSNKSIESLYQTSYQSDGHKVYLLDKINIRDNQENLLDKIALHDLLNQLEPSERELIILRYFLDKTQAQVANKLGVTQVQVSRLEKKILSKLKNFI